MDLPSSCLGIDLRKFFVLRNWLKKLAAAWGLKASSTEGQQQILRLGGAGGKANLPLHSNGQQGFFSKAHCHYVLVNQCQVI